MKFFIEILDSIEAEESENRMVTGERISKQHKDGEKNLKNKEDRRRNLKTV